MSIIYFFWVMGRRNKKGDLVSKSNTTLILGVLDLLIVVFLILLNNGLL